MSEYPDRWNDEWNDLPVDMRRFATHFGPTDAHILLLGPPGSGKGYLARILHELSPRAGGPFVPQNCGVFTESLAEAQLFGFMKGAYTGATESKPGLVEAAAGGTLFLDEFGALPPAVQPMLLTFVETGEFNRMGSTSVREAGIYGSSPRRTGTWARRSGWASSVRTWWPGCRSATNCHPSVSEERRSSASQTATFGRMASHVSLPKTLYSGCEPTIGGGTFGSS